MAGFSEPGVRRMTPEYDNCVFISSGEGNRGRQSFPGILRFRVCQAGGTEGTRKRNNNAAGHLRSLEIEIRDISRQVPAHKAGLQNEPSRHKG